VYCHVDLAALCDGPGAVEQVGVVQGQHGLGLPGHQQPTGRPEAQHVLAVLASAGRGSLVLKTENGLGCVSGWPPHWTECPGRRVEAPVTLSSLARRDADIDIWVTAVPRYPTGRLRRSLLTGCRLAGR